MKIEYKYIRFEQWEDLEEWHCINKKADTLLGTVTYYSPWRQYVIEFERGCVFNKSCLVDIAQFLMQLNRDKAIEEQE